MRNNKTALIILIVLVLGIILTVFITRQVTQTRQEASGPTNLNKGKSQSPAKNSDGTMGPSSYLGNYSNTLPQNQLGNLTVLITDPDPTKPAFPTRIPTVNHTNVKSSAPTKTALSNTNNYKSLIIQIKKAEVYNLSKDKWETLKMDFPISMDLMQLQNGQTVILSDTKLAEGKYSEIRFYIASATAVTADSVAQDLNISDTNWVVRIESEFNISKNKNSTLTVDFDAKDSIVNDKNKYFFKPFVLRFSIK